MTIPSEEFAEESRSKIQSDSFFSRRSMSPADNPSTRVINYISFGSGSSGNCCYVGTRQGGILVDAGVKDEQVVSQLKANGVRMENVKGILLTHDHSDHMRLLCTNRVLNGLLRRHGVSKRIKDYHVPIFKEIPFSLAEMEITAFDVPHDGTDNMGFSINYDNRNFVIATDLGAVTDRAHHYMSRATYLVIEANYDLRMLLNGPYPEYLKARIRTDHGHLDNTDTARFLQEIYSRDLKYVFLCHLSKDNNTPGKALRAVREALEAKGVRIGSGEESLTDRAADLQLVALPRFDATRWYVFRP